jgi:hypothetical protein
MALPITGKLTLGDIRDEFGGSNPVRISDYYRGGGIVPNTATNSDVPTSGTIKLSDFYGASNATLPNYVVLRATSQSNACNNSGTTLTIYQRSTSFNYTDLIYADANGNSLAVSGWYTMFFSGTVRQWTGTNWVGPVVNCGGGGGVLR